MTKNFGVAGSPINHSKSPALHRAAIALLSVDARYTATEISETELPGFLTSLDDTWSGLSLTMPLKTAIRPLLIRECATSRLTGSVNTAFRGSDGWEGFNTDVWGAATAIEQNWGRAFESAILLGAGATASSLIVSLRDLGIDDVVVVARDYTRAQDICDLGRRVGINARAVPFGAPLDSADIVVSSLPATALLPTTVLEHLDAGVLFDVVYDPWPSALAREWDRRGLDSLSGLHMLLWQAVRQARVFYGVSVDEPLPNEEMLVTAMRAAVGI